MNRNNINRSNEKYKRNVLLQNSYTVDFLTKKTKVNDGEIPQYYVEDNHKAIIAPEVFEMVQREMTKRSKGKKYHSGAHAFSTKIKWKYQIREINKTRKAIPVRDD